MQIQWYFIILFCRIYMPITTSSLKLFSLYSVKYSTVVFAETVTFILWAMLLSASVYLAYARHSSDFVLGSVRLGLSNGMQSMQSPLKLRSAPQCSLHCYTCILLTQSIQWRNDILDRNTQQSMRRSCHTILLPPDSLSARRQAK